MCSHVYFIFEIPRTIFVKIGKANVVHRRVKNIQTGNPRRLESLAQINVKSYRDAFMIESMLHTDLKSKGKHYHNEWFKLTLDEVIVLQRDYQAVYDKIAAARDNISNINEHINEHKITPAKIIWFDE